MRTKIIAMRKKTTTTSAMKTGKKQNAAPQIHNYLSPLSILMLYVTSVSDLLVTETNRYYNQHLEVLEVTNSELFLAIIA
jgi:hypothetical protein